MRLVYVFDVHDPDEPWIRYRFRAPRAVAALVCRLSRHLDYALNWW